MTWPYLVRLDEPDHVADDPMDTLAKRVIASNLDHIAASHGQVLVNWAAADGSGISRASVAGGCTLWKSARLPVRLRPDGAAYPLRVRLRGRRTTAGTVAKFQVRAAGGSAWFHTTSTTGAWLTAEASPLDDLIDTDATQVVVANLVGPQSLSGAPIAYPEAVTEIVVHCSVATGSTVELTGLHVSEYVGL